LDSCRDIEDLGEQRICKKTGLSCSGSGNCTKKQNLHLSLAEDQEWHKVYSLKEIFEIFQKIGDKPYMLVAGNTAHGVYRRPTDIQVFIDVNSVDELRDHNIGESLEIGGNTTLSEAMHTFMKASSDNQNFSYLDEVIKHLDLVANVPVRNFGTLSGNLMVKHQHREFPSDVFLLLETVGAKLTVSSSETESTVVSPKDFLELDMDRKIISKITLPQYNPSIFVFRSYKIMPRAQNAHAYVNAAFLMEFTDSKSEVLSARICLGGINPKTIHTAKLEAYLVGKNLYTNQTLQVALKTLLNEIKPDWNLPDASPGFRRRLALSLFYKFVLNTAPMGSVGARYLSGGKLLERNLSSGLQIFQTNQKNWPLTKNIPKLEANVQCTGEAEYICDKTVLPGELNAAYVLAKEVHLRIREIDASEALVVSQQGMKILASNKSIQFLSENPRSPCILFG
jgi:xanthine dehydrogenase/oxidase